MIYYHGSCQKLRKIARITFGRVTCATVPRPNGWRPVSVLATASEVKVQDLSAKRRCTND